MPDLCLPSFTVTYISKPQYVFLRAVPLCFVSKFPELTTFLRKLLELTYY